MSSIPTINDVQNTAEHPARLLEIPLLRFFKFLGQHFSKEKFTIFKESEIFNLQQFYNFLVLRVLLKFTKSFMREYMRGR